MSRKLGIVVSTPPERGDVARVAKIALAARHHDVAVEIFFMSESVRCIGTHADMLKILSDNNIVINLCAQSLRIAGFFEIPGNLRRGSQDTHASLVHECDRVIAFT